MLVTKNYGDASVTVINPGDHAADVVGCTEHMPGHKRTDLDAEYLYFWFTDQPSARRAAAALREVFYDTPPSR